MDDEQLKRALRTNNPGSRGLLCPKDEMIAGYAEGRLGPKDRGRVEGHLAGCDFCRRQVAALVQLAEQPLPEVPPAVMARAAMVAAAQTADRGARSKRWLWVAVTACLVLGLTPLLRQTHSPVSNAATPPAVSEPDGAQRSTPASTGPEIASPSEGATISARASEFRWSAMPDSLSYRVQVLTTDGDVKWQQDTEATHLPLPPNLLAPGKYYVSVVAQLADGKSLRSAPVAFEIAPGK